MEPRIATKPAFTIVGMRTCGKNEQGELAALWAQVLPRVGEVEHKVGNACRLVREPSDDGFEYVAGLDVCCVKDLPEGMVSRTVAELRYAVSTCTLKTIGETYAYAYETWLPGSGYQAAGREEVEDFELYDEAYDPEDPESVVYVCVPINGPQPERKR